MSSLIQSLLSGRGQKWPQLMIVGAFVFLMLFAVMYLLAYRDAARSQKPRGPFLTQQAPPKKELDYKIIHVDTIPFNQLAIPNQLPSGGKPVSEQPKTATGKKPSPQVVPGRQTRTPTRPARPPQVASSPLSASKSGSDMIVINNLDQRPGGSAISGYAGLQSVRLKVILPQKTAVTNGSLVEARVIRDAHLGDIDIPRRAQLLGTARLQNNRVHIDFREIRIRGETYTCSGQAYDLKLLPGIPYNPLSTQAKQVLLDELKSAASGVPIVGRIINRPDFNPITDEITTLDEGLEMYALITNIF